MSRNTVILYFISFAVLACRTIDSNQPSNLDETKNLSSAIQQALDSTDFVGLGVAVIKENEIVFRSGFGKSNVKKDRDYNMKSIQPIGSISKLFIGTALVKGIELGYFNLDSPINEFLPFELSNPYHPNTEITLYHLVTHTSGITDSDLFWSNCYFIADTSKIDIGTDYIKSNYGARQGNIPSLQELIQEYFDPNGRWYSKENFIDAQPGKQYEYSNIGSSLAAYIIERESGVSFDSFCHQYIFDPLDMKNTSWKKGKNETLLSELYLAKSMPLPTFQLSSYPDGGLHTNVEDLSLFLHEMMRGYQGKSTFLSIQGYDLMFEKKFDILPEGVSEGTNSGIFWDWMRNGRLGHNGADPGLFTIMSFDPEKMTGSIILLNKDIMGSANGKELFGQLQRIVRLLNEFENKSD